jgi:DNA polymerase-3 subunit gamma/tau
MSYTVLARKYRSTNFDELVGQEHIAQTLKRAIESGRIAHAYLFCGTRGTGKTSTARILAKCLNCEKAGEPTTDPCGKCGSCQGIARGDDIDCIEIDAASNTGVDNVREIIANAAYRPARARFKVYIIDEVHMLSKQAFNALLKILEEPPEHVKFILATTEPEKVLPTILSRCQRYDFRNIPTREIAEHLKSIAKQEKIKADEDALFLVAKAGAGSMRDSLSLLDRLLSVGEKELTVEMIEQLLGLPKSQLVFDLAQSIGEADVKEVLSRADKMIAGGLAIDSLIASLVDHLRNLLILRTCGPDSKLVEVPGLAMKDLIGQAMRYDPVVLSQDIAILEELRRQIRQSQAGRALLDATLVRLALAEQFNAIGNVLAATDGAETTPSAASALKKKYDDLTPSPTSGEDGGGERLATLESRASSDSPIDNRTVPPVQTSPAPLPNPLPEYERKQSATAVAGSDIDDDALPAVGKVWDNSGPSLSEMLKQRQSATPRPEQAPALAAVDANVEPVDVATLPDVWQRMLDLLAARGAWLHSAMKTGRLASIEEDAAVLRFDKNHATFVKMLSNKKDLLRDIFTQAVGKPLGVRFEIDEAGGGETASGGDGGVAVMTPAAMNTTTATRVEPARPVARPVQRQAEPPPPSAAAANLIKITPELIETLKTNEPLIKGLIDELGAQIVKIEAPEPVS